MEKQISIIIPCYNIEQYIEKCVHSIEEALISKVENFEIILVDDGAKDKTPEICDKLSKEYSNIASFHKENGGLSSARNEGLKFAKGKYIVFVDGDDTVSEGIVDIFSLLENDYDLISCGYMVSNGINIIETKNNIKEMKYAKFGSFEKTQYYKNKHFENAWSHIYRRKFLEENNLLFKHGVYYEDVEFLSRAIFYANSFYMTKLCYYIYNVGDQNSITRAMKLKNYSDFFIVLNTIVEFGNKNIFDKIYYKAYRQCYSRIFYGLLINHNKLKRNYKKEITQLFVENKKLKKYPKGLKNRLLNILINIFGVKFVLHMVMNLSKVIGK